MSRLMYQKINREFMTLMNQFRLALFDFDAARNSWARKVSPPDRAKHKEFTELLEEMQGAAVVEILSIAELIREETGTKWGTILSGDTDGGNPDGFYIAESNDGELRAFECVDRLVDKSSSIRKVVSNLVNMGWKVDGPIRSSRLR